VRTLRRWTAVFGSVIAASIGLDCHGDAAAPPFIDPTTVVSSVVVSPESVSLAVPKAAQLAATIRTPSGNVVSASTVRWHSSMAAVAAVSTSGLVTAVAPGKAIVTATIDQQSGSANVFVHAVDHIVVFPTTASIPYGATQAFAATAYNANNDIAAIPTVTWASSNPSIATIDASGVAKGVAAGLATITAIWDNETASATLAVTAATSCNLVTGTAPHSESPLAKPGYLRPVIDPDFRTTITRVSGDVGTPIGGGVAGNWPSVATQNYPKDPAWNADQSLLVLKNMSGMSADLFLDGATYQVLFSRMGPSGGGEWRLHPKLPDVAVYLNPSGAVGHWNVRTNVSTVRVPAVAGYTANELGPSEGSITYDGRYIVAKAVRSSDSHVVARVIDVDGGTTGPVIDLTAAGLVWLDFVSISATGGYVFAYGDFGGGSNQHVRIWNAATGAFVGARNDYTTGHLDMTTDPAGNDVIFSGVGQAPYSHHFITRRLSDGAITDLSGAWTSYNWHVSTRNNLRPGWGYGVVNDRTGYLLDGEIFALKLDGSQRLERLAHHRSTASSYDAEPHPVASPDGKRVVFGSNWGTSGGAIQAYVVDVRNICPDWLSQ
jgi:hypothetical protein